MIFFICAARVGRYAGILLFCMLVLLSCADQEKVPPDVIPKNKMEKVLWDMVQADRFVNGFIVKPKDSVTDKKAVADEYAKVFSIHGITQEEFAKSYKFYLGRPDISKNMFDSIYTQANRRKSESMKPDSLKLKKIDSLKALRPDSATIRRRFDSLKLKKIDSLQGRIKLK